MEQTRCRNCGKMIGELEGTLRWVCPRCKVMQTNAVPSTVTAIAAPALPRVQG